MTITIADKPKVMAEFNGADQSGKAILKRIFGEKYFTPIMERVKSFEDACEEQGLNPEEILAPYAHIPEPHRLHAITRRKLITIATSWREGWVPDYNNPNQYKWLAWLVRDEGNPAGFRFYDSYYGRANSSAGAGSGLCLPNEKMATSFAKEFLPLLAILMTE